MLEKLMNKFRNETPYPEQALMSAYARLPVSFVRGEGAWLWDDKGKQYLDALGGIAVCFLGHSHPKISEAISIQARTLIHTSNLFHIQQQARLGERFCQISGMDKVFFGNSGTEANEAAIKISRLHARKRHIDKPIVITMHDSFHGRSFGALSASANPKIHEGFAPLLEGFEYIGYNDTNALAKCCTNPNVVAVMLEPIQGEGGIVVPEEGYLKDVRELCDKQNWLMIMDEIQAGIGRTGKWFGYQHEGVLPDVITSAKALGNGIPIGACAARGEAAELIGPGAHGTTFGGNPFASQVALTVLQVIDEQNLLTQAAEKGTQLMSALRQHLGNQDKLVEVRGRGLMIGVELDKAYDGLAQKFLDKGLVVNITGAGKVIRLLPSVLIDDKQIKQIAETISEVVSNLK